MRGFSLVEVLVALALLTVFAGLFVGASTSSGRTLAYWIEKEIAYHNADILLRQFNEASSSPRIVVDQVGSLIKTITADGILSQDIYDWKHAKGGDTCDLSNATSTFVHKSDLAFNSDLTIGGLDILNGYVYIGTDSATASSPDLSIVDMHNVVHPHIVSSLDTGTGNSTVRAIPRFIFMAEQSARHPLRVIDTHDMLHPHLVYEYTSTASSSVTGYGAGNALYYYENLLYLGLVKSVSPELFVFDVTNPASPQLLGSYEFGTQINSIVVKEHVAYIATPGTGQVHVLDVAHPEVISELATIPLPGSSVQDGKSLFIVGNTLYIGRTVGGFDNVNNHELFAFDITHPQTPTFIWSINLASSLNSLVVNRHKILLGIGNGSSRLGIYSFSTSTPQLVQSFPFTTALTSIDCEDRVVVAAQGTPPFISIFEQQ